VDRTYSAQRSSFLVIFSFCFGRDVDKAGLTASFRVHISIGSSYTITVSK